MSLVLCAIAAPGIQGAMGDVAPYPSNRETQVPKYFYLDRVCEAESPLLQETIWNNFRVVIKDLQLRWKKLCVYVCGHKHTHVKCFYLVAPTGLPGVRVRLL